MLAMVLLALGLPAADDSSHLLLVSARVITLDPTRPRAEALALAGERIAAVGSREECEQALPEGAEVIDLGGRPVLRGFFDAHAHFMNGGLSLLELDLRGCRSLEELANRVQVHAAGLDTGAWIRGRGFDQSLFAGGEWPTRRTVDAVSGGHPLLLQRVDGHAALVNTLALNMAGIGEETPDPPGGVIERDAQGVPTGILKEEAVALVARLLPPFNAVEARRGVLLALAEARRVGLTSVTDHGGDPEVYLRLLEEGLLTARVCLWGELDGDLERWITLRERLAPHRDWLEMRTLKGFVDGTFGSRTAALFEPFADDASSDGILVVDEQVLRERVIAADAAGFQVALHAIGDRAVSLALDAFAAAAQQNGTSGRRHRVEHAQVIRPSDIPRLRELGVIASVQPCHLLSDRRFALERLGAARARDSYPWRRLLDNGVVLAFGSDFPVEPLDPLRNLFSAVTRAAEGDPAEPPYFPEECVTQEEALRAQTCGSAFAAGREQDLGALRAGTLADLVVFDQPLDQENARSLLETRVFMTIAGGRIVHR